MTAVAFGGPRDVAPRLLIFDLMLLAIAIGRAIKRRALSVRQPSPVGLASNAMAVDMFLKIDGIDGESGDAKHKGEIEIESFSWGASDPGTAGPGGGGSAGRVTMEDFTFTTPATRASPKLFLACVERRRIKTALLTVRRSGGHQHDFLKVTMSDVQVSAWRQASDAELPMDQVSLNFGKVQIAYTGQRPDGSAGDTVSAGWDSKNAKL